MQELISLYQKKYAIFSPKFLKMKQLNISLFFLFSATILWAQGGGMWIPNELPDKEMKQLGMKIKPNEIFNSNQPSIKDAIVHFNRGCTAEVISNQGLLLTNHHCGYGQIQSHSTVEKDYLTDGFWAMKHGEELPNPGLTATFIIDIQEVTNRVNNDNPEVVKKNIKEVEDSVKQTIKPYQDARVKAYYGGNKYYLILEETYKDVRLVGAPPSSIGKYGSDTDNWVWPRHTGDFSIFRIYADKNNLPAEYSEHNIPYQPKHSLPVSIKGLEEGDFTMVFGFPGSTNEYLPAEALRQIIEVQNPAKIKIREEVLAIMDKKMRKDNETRIKYASKFARIANYWKKWIGENQGLKKSKALELRKEYEQRFKQKALKTNSKENQSTVLNQLTKAHQSNEDFELARGVFDEAIYRNSETFRIALLINNLLDQEGDDFNAYAARVIPYLDRLYKDYDGAMDQEISLKTYELYQELYPIAPPKIDDLSNKLSTSIITQEGNLVELLSQISSDKDAVVKSLKQDELISAVRWLRDHHDQVMQPAEPISNEIAQLQKKFMQAQLDLMQDEKTFFPDANSTLRITYGQIKGYEPRDAVYYKPQTYLDGVIEKHIPGDYEFDVSDRLLELYDKKNYGSYTQDGKIPVNFIATNHTTGGNSGSPALDANGNLIGLNFDRVWEGTMSDYHYDPIICRNIMVDMRYILFVIDQYAGAKHLIKEMKIID